MKKPIFFIRTAGQSEKKVAEQAMEALKDFEDSEKKYEEVEEIENLIEEKNESSNTNKFSFEDFYPIGAWIIGFVIFVGVWIYAFASWGFLVGIAIGWLPALIAGFIGGFLWPILLLIGFIVLILALAG